MFMVSAGPAELGILRSKPNPSELHSVHSTFSCVGSWQSHWAAVQKKPLSGPAEPGGALTQMGAGSTMLGFVKVSLRQASASRGIVTTRAEGRCQPPPTEPAC